MAGAAAVQSNALKQAQILVCMCTEITHEKPVFPRHHHDARPRDCTCGWRQSSNRKTV